MTGFYQTTNDVNILKQRIEELSHIRQGYAVQLGSSLYEATKSDPDLRWGRESLYDGIAECDEERTLLCERLRNLEGASNVQNGEETEGHELNDDEGEPLLIEDTEKVPQIIVANNRVQDAILSEPEPIVEASLQPHPRIEVETAAELKPEGDTKAHIEPQAASELASGSASKSVCPNCGAPVSVSDKFCMECGASLQVVSKPQVCPACGNPVDPSFKFCMSCGHKLV